MKNHRIEGEKLYIYQKYKKENIKWQQQPTTKLK